jgi:hypothetical protein
MLLILSEVELNQIKAAKIAANLIIMDKKKKLTERLKKLRSSTETRQLEQQRDSLNILTGLPVYVKIADGEPILLDFELLKKFDRKIDSRLFDRTVKIENRTLYLDYRRYNDSKIGGVIELYDRAMLQGCPISPAHMGMRSVLDFAFQSSAPFLTDRALLVSYALPPPRGVLETFTL